MKTRSTHKTIDWGTKNQETLATATTPTRTTEKRTTFLFTLPLPWPQSRTQSLLDEIRLHIFSERENRSKE